MNVIVVIFCLVGYLNFAKAEENDVLIKKLLRRLFKDGRRHIDINELPTNKTLPGHSLIKPEIKMLKSAVNFPQDQKKSVYGNQENIGIRYGEEPLRVLYTGFRKGNNLLATILKAARGQGLTINIKDLSRSRVKFVKNSPDRAKNNRALKFKNPVKLNMKTRQEALDEKTKRIEALLNGQVIVYNNKSPKEDSSTEREWKVREFLNILQKIKMELPLDDKTKYIEDFLNNKIPVTDIKYLNNENFPAVSSVHLIDENENNANEILDQYSSEDNDGLPNYRRSKKSKPHKYRQRDSKYDSAESEDSDVSASSDYERNPGNPFTIHKNKYKKNWLWNHFMDGNHMNINPFAPPFANMGPTGVDLFFGRKWWYYNQDDYKPMG